MHAYTSQNKKWNLKKKERWLPKAKLKMKDHNGRGIEFQSLCWEEKGELKESERRRMKVKVGYKSLNYYTICTTQNFFSHLSNLNVIIILNENLNQTHIQTLNAYLSKLKFKLDFNLILIFKSFHTLMNT